MSWRVDTLAVENPDPESSVSPAERASTPGAAGTTRRPGRAPRTHRASTARPPCRAGGQPVSTPDLIARDFTAAVPGTRLVGDNTYLRTEEARLYLATVIDLATRSVVGWQTAEHMRTQLVLDALAMA
jgi:transposase InsO family protein